MTGVVWCFLGVAAVSLTGWGVYSTRRLLYPAPYPISPPSPLPSYSRHVLTAPDGAVFDVWVLQPSTPPRAFVVVCHGYYANRFQVLDLADGLRQRGYTVGLLELRGHGTRPGPCTLGVKEADDLLAVVRWATAAVNPAPRPKGRGFGEPPFRDSPPSLRSSAGLPWGGVNPCTLPVAAIGFSMGAAVACQAAAQAHAIHALVVDSIYSRLLPVIQRSLWQRYHLPVVPWAWATWWGLHVVLRRRLAPRDPAALAPRLHLPLLAIQGGEDRRVVPLLGREFYQRWAGPKQRWFEPTVAHVGMFARHPETYCDRIAAFLDEALPCRPSPS